MQHEVDNDNNEKRQQIISVSHELRRNVQVQFKVQNVLRLKTVRCGDLVYSDTRHEIVPTFSTHHFHLLHVAFCHMFMLNECGAVYRAQMGLYHDGHKPRRPQTTTITDTKMKT